MAARFPDQTSGRSNSSSEDESNYGNIWECSYKPVSPNNPNSKTMVSLNPPEIISSISKYPSNPDVGCYSIPADSIVHEFDPLMHSKKENPKSGSFPFLQQPLPIPPHAPRPPESPPETPPIPPPRFASMKNQSGHAQSPDYDLKPALTEEEVYQTLSRKIKDPFSEGTPFKDFDESLTSENGSEGATFRMPIREDSDTRSKMSSLNSMKLKRDFDGESIENLSVEGLMVDSDEVESDQTAPKKTFVQKDSHHKGEIYVLEDGLISPWKLRWLCLDDDELSIYASETSKVTKRVIPVERMKEVTRGMSEGKFKFVIKLDRREFVFGHTEESVTSQWAQTIMHAIIKKETQKKQAGNGSTFKGKTIPVKKTFLKIEGIRNKRLFVLSVGRLSYYESEEDYLSGVPIHWIDLKLANIRPTSKNRAQLVTSYRLYTLCFDNPIEMNEWTTALQMAAQEAISGDSSVVLERVYANPSNQYCADCDAPDPNWAAVNMAITLCENCAGVHRSMGMPYSKVCGITLDAKIWTETTLSLMNEVGNQKANSFWEANVTGEKIGPTAESTARAEFITQKYKLKQFADLHPLKDNKELLNEELCQAVQLDNLLKTMRIFFSGADILYKSKPFGFTAYKLAQNVRKTKQVEFLMHNGGAVVPEAVDSSKRLSITRRTSAYHCAAGVNSKLILKVKVGAAREFQKKCCMLENASLKLHPVDNNCGIETVKCGDMMLVSVDENDSLTVRLFIKRNPIKSIVFGEMTASDYCQWKLDLCKSFCPPSCNDKDINNYCCAGWVMLKYTAVGDWLNVWISLIDRTLKIYDEEKKVFESHDLRKAISIAVSDDITPYSNVPEISNPLALSLHSFHATNMYIQGETQEATKIWLKALEYACMRVGTTLAEQILTKDNIPVFIDKALKFLDTHGLTTEGVYRISGVMSRVRELYESMRRAPYQFHLVESEWEVHEVAGALKLYLRCALTEPPLASPSQLYQDWITASRLTDESQKYDFYKSLLGKLPEVNYKTVRRLIGNLAAIHENEAVTRMNAKSIAIIFGALLLGGRGEGADERSFFQTRDSDVVFDLILSFDVLFDVTEEEKAFQKKIQKAIQVLANPGAQPPVGNKQLMVDIHVKLPQSSSAESEVESITLEEKTTVKDVLTTIFEKRNMTLVETLGLFEVIISNEIERVLPPDETLYAVVMRWGTFDDTYSRKVCLVVKYNYIAERLSLAPHTEPSTSGFILQVRLSEKRTFKRGYCYAHFDNDKLQLYKARDCANEMYSWTMRNLAVYMGIEKKRSSPTEFGITLLPLVGTPVPSGKGVISNFFGSNPCFFGMALAFDKKADMDKAYNYATQWKAAKLREHETSVGHPSAASRISQRYHRQ